MAENEPWLQTDAPAPKDFWMKRWLAPCFGPRLISKEAAQAHYHDHYRLFTRRRLIVAILVAIALVIMGLLLFWNYQCIMVWHLCHEDGDYSGLPTFGDG